MSFQVVYRRADAAAVSAMASVNTEGKAIAAGLTTAEANCRAWAASGFGMMAPNPTHQMVSRKQLRDVLRLR
jgi:hypothetical protein